MFRYKIQPIDIYYESSYANFFSTNDYIILNFSKINFKVRQTNTLILRYVFGKY